MKLGFSRNLGYWSRVVALCLATGLAGFVGAQVAILLLHG
jgi:hypothetical protein